MPDDPMRVLHVHSGNLFGGVETLLVTLARNREVDPGHRHDFALCFPGRCADDLAAAGATPTMLGEVRVRRPWTVLAARRRLSDLLRRERPDVVVSHSPWAHAVFAPAVRAARVPLVFWRHGATDGRHWLERWARRTAPDLMICNSRFGAATAPRLFRGVPCEVLYYPVELAETSTGPLRSAVRATLGTAEQAVVIIQVSRMEPWKGQAVLIEALGSLGPRADWACWMVGGAQRPGEAVYERGLARRSEELGLGGRIRFLGQRGDVPSLLAAADIFCQPNTGPEPFGIVFVEALGRGLPVVATDIGAAPEIVDRSCGILVPPGESAALAAALASLLDDRGLRGALAAAAPARAASLCHPARQLGRLDDLLRGVLRGESLLK
jgi:glycosyltransferase involved in cell wall biosynthesis